MSGFDPLRALRVLNGHGVRYVVIGGFAGNLLGSPTLTYDLDVCADRRRENLVRLADALNELEGRLRGAPPDVVFPLDELSLANAVNITLDTTAGPLDVVGAPAGPLAFDDLIESSSRMDLGDDVVIDLVALEDLIVMKRAAGRPKDLFAVEILEALQLEIEGIPEPPPPIDR